MIHTCTQCGGIYSDAEGEAIAGKACMCNRARLVYLTEQDVRRIVREELVAVEANQDAEQGC